MPKKTKTTPKATKSSDKMSQLIETIVEAAGISEQITSLTAKLEDLKQTIRQHAVPLIKDGENNVKIDTELGKCVVSMMRDHLVMAPGGDAEVLKLTLQPELWNTFFVMKPAFRTTATDAWLRLNEEQRAQLGSPVPFELAPRAAQVKLPK